MSRLSTCAKAAALAGTLLAPPALGAPFQLTDVQLRAVSAGTRFTITDQVSDQTGVAPVTDPLLVNSWGLSQGPGTALWVANNGSDTSTLYSATNFSKVPLNVAVPGAPTGAVFVGINGAFDFTSAGKTGNTVFAFDTEGGQIEAWNPNVNLNSAVIVVDQSKSGSVFKGLTLGMKGATPLLFTADFGTGRVEAFNTRFQKVESFTDPYLPQGFAPFNVQTLNGQLYVTYALRKPGSIDEVDGRGLGFVDVFDTSGHLLRRVASGGALDAPWGLAIAPASFGRFAGDLLVGNFGNGRIDAYDPKTGRFLGQLKDGPSKLQIDGLWALQAGPNGTLTFSSGPDGENHGLVGSIAAAPQRWSGAEVASMAEMHGR